MTVQRGQVPSWPLPSFPRRAASFARPVPWFAAEEYDEASCASLSSSKKSQPAMSST
jgi:hypothetical protein